MRILIRAQYPIYFLKRQNVGTSWINKSVRVDLRNMVIMVESVFVERGAQRWSQETLGLRDITHLLLSSRLRPESLNNLMSRPMSAFSRKYFLKF